MKELVDLVVEREWRAPLVARGLQEAGMLGTLYGGFPKSRYVTAAVPAEHIISSPLPALWNHAANKLRLPGTLRMDEPKRLAGFVAGQTSLSKVVVSFATCYQFLFPKLVCRDVVRVIECGSMHPEDHFHLEERARQQAGLSFRTDLPERIRDEMEVAKSAHFLMCGSQMVVDSYVNRGYSRERAILCPYGIDTDRFAYAARRVQIDSPLRIAMVGIISVRKGIWRLLEIARWAAAAGHPVELWLIGPVEPDADALIARSGVSVRRCGVLKGNDLVTTLHQADIYCLPSYEEGFPKSLIEAMASGMFSITSGDTGGREAIRDGIDGLVLHDFTAAEFASKLQPWLQDAPRRLAAAKAGSDSAQEQFSLPAYFKRLQHCYSQMLEIDSVTQLQGAFSF